jgi:dTDP-4-dehydrorhamnose reductase
LKVVYDQIGTPTYAYDLANTILDLMMKTIQDETYFNPGIFHYANEGVCSWYDLAKEIVKFKGTRCNVLPIGTIEFPTLAARPAYSVLDKSKIKQTFGIQIPWWKDSLMVCLGKFKAEE